MKKVQQQCLPNSLIGVDILCQAKSGMGKTAVFVLTVLNRLEEKKPEEKKEDANNSSGSHEVSCLVLAHTRELAYQIEKEFSRFSQNFANIKTMVIYGGEPLENQIQKLKENKPQVVVGTPGRVLAMAKKKLLNLEKIKFFILDECDKMLKELGF
jgi:ATP-dependent RNA helicase UAP56/SUB2